MSIYINLRPIHKECNSPMSKQGLTDREILICNKCAKRIMLSNIDINKQVVIDNKLILI